MGSIKANAIITVHRHQPTIPFYFCFFFGKKERKKEGSHKEKEKENLSKQQPNWTDNQRARVAMTIVEIITLI
jgi:hypothetical protein